jgi:hypothetical protein
VRLEVVVVVVRLVVRQRSHLLHLVVLETTVLQDLLQQTGEVEVVEHLPLELLGLPLTQTMVVSAGQIVLELGQI